MRTYELVAMAIAAGAVVVPVVTWAVLWLVRRDRIFVGVAPGDLPSDLEDAPNRRVGPGTEYWGEMPLRSSPPAGISPGLAGVVLDGSADGRDIAGMVLDLARRGWLVLADAPGPNQGRDWQITRVDQPLDATLDLNEVYLITNIAAPGGTTRMSELRSKGDNRLGLVQLDLAREVVARGWYPAPPSQPSDVPMAVLGLGGLLGVVVALMNVSAVSLTAGSVVVACAYLTSLIVRGNTPRTALGTAVRIQVLGFRRYLEEARSHQFSYIDAAGTFREYLPWAVVFGFEARWAEVFAELDVVAEVADLHLAQDLRWFAGIKGPEDALTPTPERPEIEGTPRRLALIGDTDDHDADADTVLVPGRSAAEIVAKPTAAEPEPAVEASAEAPLVEEPTVEDPLPEEIAEEVHSPAVIDAVPLAAEPAAEVLVERFALPPAKGGALASLSATGAKVVAAAKLGASDTGRGLVIMGKAVVTVTRDVAQRLAALVATRRPGRDEPTLRIPVSPATPVRAETAPAAPAPAPNAEEAPPAVRQWVPRPSVRPSELKPRPRPAMPAAEPSAIPTAPVTPKRPPHLDAAPITPPARAPRGGPLPPWSDWLDEFDMAMSGDFDAEGPDATEGGTVISGPERFDVLLTVPLWPDVPLETHRNP